MVEKRDENLQGKAFMFINLAGSNMEHELKTEESWEEVLEYSSHSD